ncbi:MAG TPA: SDR family oxidoreductase [Anaerolineaceae bacterium]
MEELAINRLFDFHDQVVVVTGSGRGIGRRIALRMSEAGAGVVVHYHTNPAEAQAALQEIELAGGKAVMIQADLTHGDEVNRMVEACTQEFGKINIWVNNIGKYPVTPISEMSEQDWDSVLSANLSSVFLCTQAASRQMISQGKGGCIINISSIEGSFPSPGHSHYSTSKAGVIMYTQAAALELGIYDIRVNSISPGLINRPGLEKEWKSGVDAWKRAAPLRRLGEPIDIADACLFLASPAARWITGINLIVDGGASVRPLF